MNADGTKSYTADVFSSLRLIDTTFGTQAPTDYDRSATTDSVYLVSEERAWDSVVYSATDPIEVNPVTTSGQHVFLEIEDPLGSTSSVMNQATGELVERTTYTSYGRVESDYWTGRWADYREQYKFTGKETDVALGMTYFGARYYSAYLGSWMSPDPLTIHTLGADMNPYAYVGGHVIERHRPIRTRLQRDGCDAIRRAIPGRRRGSSKRSGMQSGT